MMTRCLRCLHYAQKRTFGLAFSTSALCQQATIQNSNETTGARLEAFRKHASSLTRAKSGKPTSLELLQAYPQYHACGLKIARVARSGKKTLIQM